MARELAHFNVVLRADAGSNVLGVLATYVILDDSDATYFARGKVDMTVLPAELHEAIRRIVHHAQLEICAVEGLACSSSSSSSESL